MNEKLSFQNITDTLAQKAGVQKKVSETFTKAFFDTIVEALYMGEDTIKVKGLGTFKLVEVGSRESVNVSNGERIVISGYKKVSFTPDDSVVDFLNSQDADNEQALTVEKDVENEAEENEETLPIVEIDVEQEDIEMTVQQPEFEETNVVDDSINLDEILQTPIPERVEMPQDEFAGIDMLISTPESVDEIRQQYADATVKADEAVAVARKALEDKLRLQKLLERLEANVVPESAEMDSISEEEGSASEEEVPTDANDISIDETSSATDASEETETTPLSTDLQEEQTAASTDENEAVPLSPIPQDCNKEDEEDKKNLAFERIMQDPSEEEQKSTNTRKKSNGAIWVIPIVVLLLAVIVFFLYKTFISIDAVKEVAPIPETTQPKTERQKEKPTVQSAKKSNDTKAVEVTKDTTRASTKTPAPIQPKPSASSEAQPSRPTTYIIKKGESLTLISQRFYGTKDSVRAIIRVNDFTDPNNVPVGAKVKLP